jgi:hypothetical protein
MKGKVTHNAITILPEGPTIMITLNQLESSMLIYCSKNKIRNPYKFFADQCGYKEENYFYHLFQQRAHYKLGLSDIKKIYEITQDKKILEAMLLEVENA